MVAGLTFRTTDPLKWGTGKGSPLSSDEGDENVWTLHERIDDLETNPPLPVSIVSFEIIGSQFVVHLSDGSTQGPFDMPIATFQLRGEWVNDMTYSETDVVSVVNRGLYLVRIDHTTPAAPAEFDPDAEDGLGNKLYLLLFGEDSYIYDIGFFYPGKPGLGIDDGAAMAGFVFTRDVTLPATLPGSVAKLKTACAAAMDFKIQVNAVDKGTIHFNLGSTTGAYTFAADVECVTGDVLTILKPTAGIDTNAREFSATIRGTRLFG